MLYPLSYGRVTAGTSSVVGRAAVAPILAAPSSPGGKLVTGRQGAAIR
jgi:hypothetical protein